MNPYYKIYLMKDKVFNYLIGFLSLVILLNVVIFFRQKNVIKEMSDTTEISLSLLNQIASPVEVINLKGETEKIFFCNSNKKILLIIISPSCIMCEKNFTFWNRLYLQLQENTRFFGIILSDLHNATFIQQTNKITFPLFIPKNKNIFRSTYNISHVSKTILINENQKIRWVKSGELNREDYLLLKKLIFKKS